MCEYITSNISGKNLVSHMLPNQIVRLHIIQLFCPSAFLIGENDSRSHSEMLRRPRHHKNQLALLSQLHVPLLRFFPQTIHSKTSWIETEASTLKCCSENDSYPCRPKLIQLQLRCEQQPQSNTYLSRMQKDILIQNSFTEYYADHFSKRYPHFAAFMNPAQPAFAASVYLFRYDPRLSPEFIQSTVDAFARTFADISGKSVQEARRVFTSDVRDTAREYFTNGWHHVDNFLKSNKPVLQILRKQNTELSNITDNVKTSDGTIEVDPVLLQALLEKHLPVLVFVYADYCSVCKMVRPVFEDAAKSMGNRAYCVRLNGPRAPEFKDLLNVHSYPSLLRFENGVKVRKYPLSSGATVDKLISFAQDADFEGITVNINEDNSGGESNGEITRSAEEKSSPWTSMLLRQGIDQLDILQHERSRALRTELSFPYECDETSCKPLPIRRQDLIGDKSPPLCVLLGGGMGAGKTTAINFISQTHFWKQYGAGVVVVEADAFKMNDPLFVVLQSVTPLASRIVHQDSLKAAEDLFLQAVNNRRDVCFDGTLSWCEYARQTVSMLKDSYYYYERGPGYVESESGVVTEKYWVRGKKRDVAVTPYRVELVGVTAEAEIAVMRGIVRKISTGRGVAIPDQLRSHALFSEHFETYIDIVDSVYLFDTSLAKEANKGQESPRGNLIAIKEGFLFQAKKNENMNNSGANRFIVYNPSAYSRFLRKKHLNTTAGGTDELFAEIEDHYLS